MQPAMKTRAAPSMPGLLEADPAGFRRDFNRASFTLHHGLAGHPLFETPRLARLAEAMQQRGDRDKLVALGARETTTATRFSDMTRLPAADTLRRLDEIGTWMKLSHAHEVDAEYRELMDGLLLELEALSRQPLRELISWKMLTIFLASPHIVTPYHIDHESNFLLQVRGSKQVCLFDGQDRSILPVTEIEQFYAGNAEAARYRPDLAGLGTLYRLTPGTGVHHPPLAPHWVRNGGEVSVSVSVSFCLRPLDREAKIHQANLVMRRLGLHPATIGQHPLGDRIKDATIRMVSSRHPATRSEMLFSGVRRLGAPVAAARRLARVVRPAAAAPPGA